ncbi:hypothetical protein [Fischerella major]|uniref:hypothetical protein n=1 Tax=Fischerella major TaxID=210993 RepID=UPI000A983EC5|nr:hypothetical protein [Fischerella major]
MSVRYSKIYLPSHRLELNRTNYAQRSPIGVHRLALCSIFKNISFQLETSTQQN